MPVTKISDVSYTETLNAFQPFYKETLTRDDAIEIQNNLYGLCYLLRKNKERRARLTAL